MSCRIVLPAALTVTLFSSIAWAQTGAVTGSVRHAPSGTPVPGVTVTLVDAEGYITGDTGTSNDAGRYQILNVPAGRYYAFTTNQLGLTNEIYDDLLCRGGCAPAGAGLVDAPASPMCFGCLLGTPIIVTAGATASGKDFGLDLGGGIAGRVTAADTGNPLAGVTVTANLVNPTGGSWPVSGSTTDANGEYLIRGLPAGQYYASTLGAPTGYVNEIFDNVHCGHAWGCSNTEGGTPIEVALGVTSGGTNFELERGGRITGVVRDAVTLAPVPGACVDAYRYNPVSAVFDFAGWDCADSSGAYAVEGLVSGNHYAVVKNLDSSGYVTALYDGLSCVSHTCDLTDGTAIPVTFGDTTSGVDFDLVTGGVIRGVVRDAATSAPLSYPFVRVFRRLAGGRIEGASSIIWPAPGEYEIRMLPPGTYYAYTQMRVGHVDEIFDNIPCPNDTGCEPLLLTTGTPITVNGGGAVTSGIDFDLSVLTGPPAAPSGLRAFVNDGLVGLAWEPPLSGPTFTDYVLEAGLSPGSTAFTASTNSSPYDVPGVVPGRYYVRVRARNSFGIGPPTDDLEVNVPPYGPTAPLAPPTTRPFVWMSGRRLTLTWAAPTAGAEPTGYLVEAGTAAGLANIGSALVAGQFLTFDPVPDGFYFLRVRAVRGSDRSEPSLEIMLNVGNVPAPPGAPTALAYSLSGSTVNLTWTAPTEGAPTSYTLEAGSGPGLADLLRQDTGSAATSLAYAGVPPGRYYVRVRAVNSLGAGVASNEVVVIVP
ncbi:MAG: carboxypeptidase regulatory-like domain-containing protein [Acidobacteria bacterium]|nr:carboxypeptidase regulatory-like domain-containing protein [Acidobacteriota bacterium]